MPTGEEHKVLNKYAAQRNPMASEIIQGCLPSLIEGLASAKGDRP
jgi:hypothetical protein